jgi:hypothetical protein
MAITVPEPNYEELEQALKRLADNMAKIGISIDPGKVQNQAAYAAVCEEVKEKAKAALPNLKNESKTGHVVPRKNELKTGGTSEMKNETKNVSIPEELTQYLVGKWKGRNVYTITLQQYIDNEVVCADSDYFWIISDKLDAHRYPYVIDGGDVVFAYNVQMNTFVNKTRIPARKKFGFGSSKAGPEVKAKQESNAQTRGNPGARQVTERKSVEWYMQHTLEVLSAGRKYGEQRLAQLSGRKLG